MMDRSSETAVGGFAMFKSLKLKPPHGWNAVVWDLAIVTVGVLIALGLAKCVIIGELVIELGVAQPAIAR